MTTHQDNIATLGWDPNDHHGHPVVSWQTQLAVLAALLFFTFSTVLFYNLESWIETAFQIHLPNWINIVGAMSIALIKAILVCMFFMGLKYDKVLNTFAMLFCLFCVGLFLGIIMIDLESRDAVEPWRKGEITLGGTGVGLNNPSVNAGLPFGTTPAPLINTAGLSMVEYTRQQAIEAAGSENAFWADHYAHHATHQHAADESNFYAQLGYTTGDINLPDANHALPRTGLTAGLFDAIDPTAPATSHETPTNNGH